MFTVRFISGKGQAFLAVIERQYATKRDAIAGIKRQGYRPGPRVLERGRVIRLAYELGITKSWEE